MKKTYIIVMHDSGNGFVVRTAYDGWLPQPYTNALRLKEYTNEKYAQKCANRFNCESQDNR